MHNTRDLCGSKKFQIQLDFGRCEELEDLEKDLICAIQ